MEATGVRVIKYRKADAEFSLYDVADIHYLNRGCLKSFLQRDIEKIRKDPYSFWFLGGDYADWIKPGDSRFDPEAFDEEFKVNDLTRLSARTLSGILSFLNPIGDKCLGACIGNHEHFYMTRNSEMFVHDALCYKLNVPNMGFSGWTDIYFVRDDSAIKPILERPSTPPGKFIVRLRIFIHHGAGAANTPGGKINMLKRLVDMSSADLVMTSHLHEHISKAFVRLEPNADCTEMGQKVTMGLMTGSYLANYAPNFTGYGEIRAYWPSMIGASRARYKPETGELVVENRAQGVGKRG